MRYTAALALPDRLVAIDCETTGRSPLSAAALAALPKGMRPPGILIQVGCVEVLRDGDSWTLGRTWETLVQPDAPIRPHALRIHGIRAGMLNGAPRFPQIVDPLLAFLGEAPLIAHAAHNDFGFLNYEFRRARLAEPGVPRLPYDRFLCTHAMADAILPRGPRALDRLCDQLWIDCSDRLVTHCALPDALLAAEVFIALDARVRQRQPAKAA